MLGYDVESDMCFRWTLNGTFISSGQNQDVNGVESTLQWNVALVTSGKIRFSYKVRIYLFPPPWFLQTHVQVDAEGPSYDGLVFYVDDVAWPMGDSRKHIVSYVFDYTLYEVLVHPTML